MLKKSITYTDPFTDEEVTKTFYFNLTKAEMTKLMLKNEGSYAEYLESVVSSKSASDIFNVFESLIRAAYGERTVDGRFIKSEEISDAFMHSEAYSVLLYEFLDDKDGHKAASFFEQICPKDLISEVKKDQNVIALA